MKLAWFTPLARGSAIGTFSRHVARRLAEEVDVRLWVAASEDELQAADVPVVRYEPGTAPALADDELAVYNFGNYLPYHEPIYEASRQRPGIAILHDRVLHPMFATYWLSGTAPQADLYLRVLESLYGRRARRLAAAALRGDGTPAWELDDELLRQPLYEEAIVGALGVVSHSARHAEEIAAGWLGPVRHLHLPCYADVLASGAGAATHTPAPRPDGRLRMLVVGHVNPNKRIDRLIELLADDPWLAARVHLDVIGSQAYEAYVRQIVRRLEELGDRVSVELHGVVGNDVLERHLVDADVYANLRHPAMESASASLLEQLAHGRPVLVFDTGFFAEVPADAVVRVPVEDWDACAAELRALVEDPGRRTAVGAAARRVAERYSVDAYAGGLLEHVRDVRRWHPGLGTLDRATRELARMGMSAESPAAAGLLDHAGALFGDRWTARPVLDDPEAAVTFRELEPGDRAAFHAFMAANDVPAVTGTFTPFPMTAETADRILDETREDRFFGAFAAGGEMIAFSMLRGWDEGYEVPSFGIAVDHRHQGRGVGGRLTRWTVRQAAAMGAPAVRLSVYTDNAVAVGLYRELGFTELERGEVDGRDRLVMRLAF